MTKGVDLDPDLRAAWTFSSNLVRLYFVVYVQGLVLRTLVDPPSNLPSSCTRTPKAT